MKYSSQIIKNKIREISKGNNKLSYLLLRLFFMENFIKRISKSSFSSNFILKGGLLITQELGINSRVTKDIDTTMKSYNLSLEDVTYVMNRIIGINLQDGIEYSLKNIEEIMDDHEYPGIRVSLIGKVDNTTQPFQMDISTGDVITPGEIEYEYKLLFEPSTINIFSYNLETILSEKIETILDRNITNTRMRDFYDIYMIYNCKKENINFDTLKNAFYATMNNRNTLYLIDKTNDLLKSISNDEYLKRHWNNYRNDNSYVSDISFEETVEIIQVILKKINIIN